MNALAYRSYWKRKSLISSGPPHFGVVRWWPSDCLCPSEEWIFEKSKNAKRLLDYGAGDLKYRSKFLAAGFRGNYLSFDIGCEFPYDFQSQSSIDGQFDTILCLDVIEHMPLEEGLELIDWLIKRLNPGGNLIIQTPNARCIRNPYSWDMTHVHSYNATDLWSWLAVMGLEVELRRVRFSKSQLTVAQKFKEKLADYVITQLIGADYADNLLISACKK